MRTTPENITSLKPNQIFVFGSNTAGIHGKGAARFAQVKFGAKKFVAEGPTGQCYAIPTRRYLPREPELWRPRLETLPTWDIQNSVETFLKYATEHPDTEFLVTKIGCGFAGYDTEQIAPMFKRATANVILPKEFRLETQSPDSRR